MTEVPTNPDRLDQAGTATLDPDEVDQAVRGIGEVPAVEGDHHRGPASDECGGGQVRPRRGGRRRHGPGRGAKAHQRSRGLVVTSAPDLGTLPAAARRAESLQLAFREASEFPDPIGRARREADRTGHLSVGAAAADRSPSGGDPDCQDPVEDLPQRRLRHPRGDDSRTPFSLVGRQITREPDLEHEAGGPSPRLVDNRRPFRTRVQRFPHWRKDRTIHFAPRDNRSRQVCICIGHSLVRFQPDVLAGEQ